MNLGTVRERVLESERQRQGEGLVWRTLRELTRELDRFQVPYAVAGALALQHHGAVGRSTEDVDLLVSSDADVQTIHARLVGRGYTRKNQASRHLRDDVTRVRIEFLVAGEYPGDGQPKPVQFPQPDVASERSEDGMRFLDLRWLITLKLASAKSAAHRIKDRADVLDLIHLHKLPPSYADGLDPYVQSEFRELAALPPADDESSLPAP